MSSSRTRIQNSSSVNHGHGSRRGMFLKTAFATFVLLAVTLGGALLLAEAPVVYGFPQGIPYADPEASDGGPSPILPGATELDGDDPYGLSGTQRYFVVLEEPPLATYRGGTPGLDPTAVDAVAAAPDGETATGVHLDTASPSAQAYVSHLQSVQARYIDHVRAIAPEFSSPDWQYQIALNGFVAEMTPQHAIDVMGLPGVLTVYPEEELVPEMDSTGQLLNTYNAWDQVGGPMEAGLGARVGILEAGNALVHPFFRDEGMLDAPDGYPSAKVYGADGSSYDIPEPETLVNNKIIGARVIVEEVVTDSLETYTTSASNHGRHVSGTIAGRHGKYDMADLGAPGVEVEMGGVAPMAHVFHYYNRDGTPGMVKAYEIMIEDKIDAVNLSLGSSAWLIDGVETHPIRLAQSAAAAAGVLSVGSSGNAGANGRTSLSGAWKYSEDILVVGNSSTTGAFVSEVLLEGDEVSETLEVLLASPARGTIPITDPITADMILADEGGCITNTLYAGKMAVLERFGPEGSSNPIGGCGYAIRSENMRDSGAVAAIYIYYNLYLAGGSSAELALPAVGMGAKDGAPLVEFLRNGGEAVGTIVGEVVRSYDNVPDILSSSSSTGPGLDWSIKPDITAPGTGIISSVLIDDNPGDEEPARGGFQSMSGTSMAAPHVTGAAGLLRSVHADWTVPELRSALINTSKRSVVVGDLIQGTLTPAHLTDSGPGRLDLEYALDPLALLHPPKAAFGNVPPDSLETLEVAVASETHRDMVWAATVEPISGTTLVWVEPEQFSLAAGETITLTVSISTTDVTQAEHWGDIHLHGVDVDPIYLPFTQLGDVEFEPVPTAAPPEPTEMPTDEPTEEPTDEPTDEPTEEPTEDPTEEPTQEPTAEPTTFAPIAGIDQQPALPSDNEPRDLRLVYYAHVDVPENRDDVLIINWTYGTTADYTSYYTETLEDLGLTYSIWAMGEDSDGHADRKTEHPTYEEMYRHDLVILNANMSTVSLMQQLRGQFQYQNYMLGGGNFLIAGQGTQDWWRYLGGSALPDNPTYRERYSDTWPYRWYSYSQNTGCEMCLARYFAGWTPGLTATLSGRLLVPYPDKWDEPELEVVLQPHEEADDSVFNYGVDISTGALAKDGAAGNQYWFSTGEVMKEFVPSESSTDTTKLGDISYGDMVVERVGQFAKPLWSYPVSDTVKVVGTYVAGKHEPDSDVAWNAMFWGFGLEGVGEGADGTASRSRLLGDTFNFMARGIEPSAVVTSDPDGSRIEVSLGASADAPRFDRAEIDWGDFVETVHFGQMVSDTDFVFDGRISGDGPVSVTLYPAAGERAAPIVVDVRN